MAAIFNSEVLDETSLSSWFALLVLVLLLYLALSAIYYAFFHPLAKIPGPKLYAVSQVPYLYHMVTGDWVHVLAKLHDRYGLAVRFAPNDVSFISADALKTIYGHKSTGGDAFVKDLRIYRQGRPVSNLITSNHDDHKRMRRLLSHAFSMKALRNQDEILNRYVNLFITELSKRAQQGVAVDMVAWYNFATFDLIGHLALGQPFGCLESGQYHPWIKRIFNSIKTIAITQVITRLGLRNWVALLTPKSLKKATMEHLQFTEHAALARLDAGDTSSQDFMSYILRYNDEKGMSTAEVIENSGLLITAGSETTATLLSGTTYLLLTNREKYNKLTSEIRSAFSSEDEITLSRVDQLKYLLAVFSEGFRMYPPVPTGLSRCAPAGGEFIEGYWVPGKTAVSVPQWSAYQSSLNFKSPELFVPERWMDDPIYANDSKMVLQPFSLGPRDCIGKNLAYTEMRILLTRLLWKFDLELMPESKNWNDQKVFFLWEKGELRVKLTEVVREDSR